MRKTRKGKKWRHVYPYTCSGCGKDRIAFDAARAKAGLCTRCEGPKVHKDQGRLFSGDVHSGPIATAGRPH